MVDHQFCELLKKKSSNETELAFKLTGIICLIHDTSQAGLENDSSFSIYFHTYIFLEYGPMRETGGAGLLFSVALTSGFFALQHKH